MSARIKISQVGLPAGVAGVARTDGLDNGALVTLEDVSGTGSSTFHLLWGPPDDTTAEASLGPTVDPNIWTFSPTSGVHDTYLIELRVSGAPVERRVFGIRTAANHLLIPALNERASKHANWTNDGPDQAELSENNAVDFTDPVLNGFAYAGWWRSLRELYKVVEAGTGGLADHSVALVKLALAPAKSVIANPLAAAGDADYLVGATEFQYLRVNAANNGLEWATLAAQGSTSILYDVSTNQFVRAAVTGVVTAPQNSNTASFSVAAGKSVLINAANGSAVPAFVAGTAAFQYLRVNSANNALEWATLSTHASTSIIYDGASNQFRRAALTGDVTAAVNDNATTIAADAVTNTKAANMAANTIKANPTAGSADPQDMALAVQSLLLRAAANVINAAAGADNVLQRIGSGDLGFSVRRRGLARDQTFSSITNAVTVISPCGSYVIPAGSSAVGDRYEWAAALRFVRGATATAMNIQFFVDSMSMGTTPGCDLTSPTTAGTYGVFVRGSMQITGLGTAGGGGQARCELSAYGSGVLGVISATQFITDTIDTTAAITISPAIRMGTAVAACSLSAWGGDVGRVA